MIVHQLLWWGLMNGPDLWRAGVIGLQVFHILKLCESGKSWGDLHSDSMGSLDPQHFEGYKPLEDQFLAWELGCVVFCAKQNQVTLL